MAILPQLRNILEAGVRLGYEDASLASESPSSAPGSDSLKRLFPNVDLGRQQ